ncbi:MAG: CoA transferase [Oscillospiraceae bacterium]|jgi:CoA:oxalate CoA-transferase|nr:CoA transferase [Oscillospiraceae bacterium]MCI9548722.1 CoA transferase [Oscillospiraceae bacterium]
MGNAVFEGIRVLDFSNNVAGPCCASLLADMGAEVIKIERPVAGDDSRGIMPRVEGQSLTFIWTNRGKKSVELDLHDPEAVELIKRMIMDADIIVESFKPGQMKKFGLDYETVHAMKPSLVYCSISACGQTGAYASKPGFDIIAQGMSGLMDLAGDPDGDPVKQGVTIGDYVGSLNAYGAIVTALYHSRATGKGQLVDISLLDGLVYCNTPLDNAATNGAHPTRSGPHHGTMAPYGVYNGKNGQSVIVAAYTAAMWKRLCTAMERPDLETDERFSSNIGRTQNLKELVAVIEDWLKGFDDVQEAVDRMEAQNVASCKIRSTYEVANDPALWERGAIAELPTGPSFTQVRSVRTRGAVARYSETPIQLKRAPDLGEDNYDILGKYGWDKAKVDAMEKKWSEKRK